MTSYVTPKKGFPFICYVGLVSQSTGQFQSNPTLASGDFKVSKDGAALANLATLPAVTPASSKSVKISLDSDETNADNIIIIGSDAAGAEWDDIFLNIQTTVSQIDDLALASALANVQSDTDNIQTRLPAALSGDGFMKADLLSIGDELVSGNNATLKLKQFHVVNSAGHALLAQSTGGNGSGVYIKGGNTGGSGLEIESSDNGAALYIHNHGGNGHAIQIYDPEGGSAVDILADVGKGVNIGAVQDGLHIESYVNEHAVNLITFGTGESINAPNNIAVSDGNLTLTDIAKKILTLDWTTVTGEAARSVLNALRKLRNKVSFNGSTTLTVYKEDGTMSAYTQAVTTDDTQEPFKELG